MNIPIEIVSAAFCAILALQGWTVREIIALKMKTVRMHELEKRVKKLEEAKA